MQTFKLMLKRLLQDRITGVILVVFFAGSLGYILYNFAALKAAEEQVLFYLSKTLRLSVLVFVFLMFVSYEYFYKRKAQMTEEMLRATKSGTRKFFLSGFLALSAVLALYCAVILALNFVVCAALGESKGEYLLHVALNILLNLFLVGLLGIQLGMTISLLEKRVTSYALMLLCVFLSTPMFSAVTDAVYEGTGKNLSSVAELFNVFPPSLSYVPLATFGYSLLPYRWDLVLFWLFLSAAILFWSVSGVQKRKRAVFCAVLAAVSCLFFCAFLRPGSKVILGNGVHSSSLVDSEYYISVDSKDEMADFSIEKYTMNIDIMRQLSAEVTMRLTGSNLESYDFTLYHGYKIKSVCGSDGSSLRFEQNSDYFTVYTDGKNISGISVTYSGDAPRFFCNSQGVSLPGWFAYYPRAGKRAVYDSVLLGFERLPCPAGTEFELTINARKMIYTNLERTGNLYSGKSEGVTIVSGFYDSMNVSGKEVVYPYLNTTEFTPENIEKQVNEGIKNGVFTEEQKKLIVISGVNMISEYERFCAFSDHAALSQLNGLFHIYETQKVPSFKRQLYVTFDYYKTNIDNWKNMVEFFKNKVYAGDEEQWANDSRLMVQAVFDKLGEELAAKEIEAYLNDGTDKRDWKSFLNYLRGEKND